MARAHAALGLTAGMAIAMAGCSAILGIDGSYGDAPAGASDAASDTTSGAASDAPPGAEGATTSETSSPDGGRPVSPDDASAPAEASNAGDGARTDDAPSSVDHDAASDGGETKSDAGEAGITGPVTASSRRIAFGPSATGNGDATVFAIGSDGVVRQWSFGATMTATAATGVPGASAIAGGTHVCVVSATDQSLWCWGPNSPAPAGTTPTQLPGTGQGQWVMRGVAVGDTFTCILDDKGTVGCAGTLANWTSPGNALSYPVFTGGMFASGQLFAASDISAAGGAICVVNDSPESGLYCWGSNADLVAAPTGTVGATQNYPWVILSSPDDPTMVSVAPSHACATYANGSSGNTLAVCWGAVPEEDGGAPEAWDPVPYSGIQSVVTTGVAGTEATFLLGADGVVWGAGTWPATTKTGLLGPSYAAGSKTFVQISQLTGVQQIATSGTEACALLNDGTVECWGSSGTGAAVPPTRVNGLP